jgi:uncharacterized protein with NRDE domain
MCLIAFGHRAVPGMELLVAANRDEFIERPTSPAHFWEGHPNILAGRDLRAGGTWMGVSRTGRFAAITNFRNPRDRRTDAPSRGALVGDFLLGSESPQAYLAGIAGRAGAYNGFSLLVGAGVELWFCSNRNGAAYRIEPGVHGLSNHLLDEPWPKVRRAKNWVRSLLTGPFDAEDCFELLADETVAADPELPDTGIGLERERKASAIRIRDPVYGTRCSTVLIMREPGEVEFHERSFAADGQVTGTLSFSFSREGTTPGTAASSLRDRSPLPGKPGRAG